MSEQTPTPGPQKTLPSILTASHRVKDLVCGMLVDPEKAAAKLEYDGNNHVFCCKGCAEKFAKEPEKYLAAQDAAVKESSLAGKPMTILLPILPPPLQLKTPATPALWIRKSSRLGREPVRNAAWLSNRWMFSPKWKPTPSTTRCSGDFG